MKGKLNLSLASFTSIFAILLGFGIIHPLNWLSVFVVCFNILGAGLNWFVFIDKNFSVSTKRKEVCPVHCEEFRNDGHDLCHSDYEKCIHYKFSVEGK